MKKLRWGLASLLIILVMFSGGIEAVAIESGFSTKPLSDEDQKIVLENVAIGILNKEPSKQTIQCFDVNEAGMVAIGYQNSEQKIVCVYSNSGVFQYGYRFHTYGDFGIELHGDILNIYFVRSDVAISINPAGKILAVDKIEITPENNSYWHHDVFATKRIANGKTYTLTNNHGIFNLFAGSYSQLVVEDENREIRVIYDVSSNHFARILFFFCIAAAFVSTVSIILVFQIKKLRLNL